MNLDAIRTFKTANAYFNECGPRNPRRSSGGQTVCGRETSARQRRNQVRYSIRAKVTSVIHLHLFEVLPTVGTLRLVGERNTQSGTTGDGLTSDGAIVVFSISFE